MADRKLTIGVLIGNANSPHSINTLHGIQQAAMETGVNIIIFLGVHTSYFYRDFFEEEESYDYQVTTVYDYVKLAKVDALIISYGELVIFLNEKERRTFLEKFDQVPYVILEEVIEKKNARYQIADNYKGMRAVVEHLAIDHGYRRFVCLRGPEGNKDADERFRAFLDVMEEQDIEVTPDMVRAGDFSESVEKEVEYLFDHNPHVQAFVCGNDLMAGTVYKICKKRRMEIHRSTEWAEKWLSMSPMCYRIGHDIESGEGIAVTGYDDWLLASTMDPPLTTVLQNAYSSGYKAVYNVLDIYCKGAGENIILPPLLIRRNSCGCQDAEQHKFEIMTAAERVNPEFYAIKIAETVKNAILISDVNDSIGDRVYDILYDVIYGNTIIFLGYVKEKISAKHVVEQLRMLMTGPYADYISPNALATTYSDYLSFIIHTIDDHMAEVLLSEILIEGMKYLQAYIYKKAKDALAEYESTSWFMSLISRDMANHVSDEKEMFRNAMIKLKTLNIGNSYLYTFEKSIEHTRDEEWVCPDKMYLAAYMTIDGEVVAYEPEERPAVTIHNGFGDYIRQSEKREKGYQVTLINLYSDKTQYGVLISEISPENVLSLYYASIQIGTALKYCEMSRAQQQTQSRLEQLIKEVEDKNSMLRFISEYDSLTGCLNRRGFIEKAMNLKNESSGKEAVVIFGDLDHLKEINDKFGHSEGDFAIKKIAQIIKEAIGDDQLVSRIGGDEFVVMMLCDRCYTPETITRKIKQATAEFNECSDKPYYVESSLGFKRFVCGDEVQLQDVINQADQALYIVKKNRRESIAK
ncbi:MAG: GGDEF domain-containing protein [Lachnospiraceae bacterium]